MGMSTKPYDKEAAHAWGVVLKKLEILRMSGETLEQIGNRLGVKKATVSRWLARIQGGEKNSFGEMCRYAKRLGISSAEMFGENQTEMKPFDKKIAQELSENIEHSGMTVAQVAESVGIDQGQLENILAGGIRPELREFHAICREVGLNPTIVLNKAAAEKE